MKGISLLDLVPTPTVFKLKGKEYKLRAYSVHEKKYFIQKYGQEEYIKMLSDPKVQAFTDIHIEIAHFLLEDKTDFPTLEVFEKAIQTSGEETTVLTAALIARGMAETAILSFEEQEEIRVEELKKKTGKSLWRKVVMAVKFFISLQKNMDGIKKKYLR